MWEKKSLAPLPNAAAGPVPVPRPLSDLPAKDVIPKSDVSVASVAPNDNHSYVGSSCVLKGDLTADEDFLIEGQFDGTLNLHERCLTVGARGQVKAEVQAARVIISGSVAGNISARERIEIRKSGRVLGDLVAPSISIEDGAYFKGSIEILREEDHSTGAAIPDKLSTQSTA